MKKFAWGKKSIVSGLAMAILSGCGQSASQLLPEDQFDSVLASSTLTTGEPIYAPGKTFPFPSLSVYAVFNNAYKGLFEENEAIARKDQGNSDKYFFGYINSAKKTLDLC